MVKEGSTQIENFMTPGTAGVVLECGNIHFKSNSKNAS